MFILFKKKKNIKRYKWYNILGSSNIIIGIQKKGKMMVSSEVYGLFGSRLLRGGVLSKFLNLTIPRGYWSYIMYMTMVKRR